MSYKSKMQGYIILELPKRVKETKRGFLKISWNLRKYDSDSKVLPYFGKIRYNLVALDDFAEVVEETSPTRLCKAEFIWYSPCNTWIYFYGLEYALESTVLCLPGLVWSLKLLQLKENFLNYLFTVSWSTLSSPFAQQIFLVAFIVLWPCSNMLSISS